MLIQILLKVAPKGRVSNTTCRHSIGLENSLAPDRWQAIKLTNDGLVF